MKARDYLLLIETYLVGDLSADEFSVKYLDSFLGEQGGMPKELFDILQDLFEDVEAFSPAWTSEDERQNAFRITEPTLAKEIRAAKGQLETYLSTEPDR